MYTYNIILYKLWIIENVHISKGLCSINRSCVFIRSSKSDFGFEDVWSMCMKVVFQALLWYPWSVWRICYAWEWEWVTGMYYVHCICGGEGQRVCGACLFKCLVYDSQRLSFNKYIKCAMSADATMSFSILAVLKSLFCIYRTKIRLKLVMSVISGIMKSVYS